MTAIAGFRIGRVGISARKISAQRSVNSAVSARAMSGMAEDSAAAPDIGVLRLPSGIGVHRARRALSGDVSFALPRARSAVVDHLSLDIRRQLLCVQLQVTLNG